jgi:predicted alpha/beta-fold hydrolase
MIFMLFNIYWEMRDFWQLRWHRVELHNVISKNYQIPVKWNTELKYNILGGTLWTRQDSSLKGPLILYIYGFSDDQDSTRYFTIPIVLAGYDVLTFDTRGKKTSRKVGNKNEFVETIRDVKDVLEWLLHQPEFQHREIIIIGTSLGAISAINTGIQFPEVKKIIAISAMSNFRNNFPHSTITFLGQWWYWLRYTLFGVNLKPSDQINTELSPAIQLQSVFQQKHEIREQSNLKNINQNLILIHALDDPVVNINNFYENRHVTQPSLTQWLLTKRGGHLFRKYELILLAKIFDAIKKSE